MAKRKRLSPLGVAIGTDFDPEEEGPPTGLETKALFSAQGAVSGAGRPAPIADLAGAAAATAALEEMAETLRRARADGRMVIAIPLAQVDAAYLVRDRVAVDADEMNALIDSIRARGQQAPIEVVALSPDRYGLISGWRRLRALRHLTAEGEGEKFGSVLALLRNPAQSSDAYVAMVEENEIRVGLSFYERARIVAKAVEAGVYADDRAALRGLFGAVSRPKRSKIGSFLTVVRALDGALRFPEAIAERLGLQLAQAIEADTGLAARLRAHLDASPAPDAATELADLARLIAPPKPEKPAKKADTETVPAARAAGIHLSEPEAGRLVIEGAGVTPAFRAELEGWIAAWIADQS